MKKKNVIILGSVIGICGLGLFSSLFVDWPVDFNDAGGDIAKTTRFSREQASEKLAQMSTDALALSKPRDIQMGLASMASLNLVVKGYADVMNSVARLNQQQQLNIVNKLNSAIGEMAYGNRPTLGLRAPIY